MRGKYLFNQKSEVDLIERTVITALDLGENGERTQELIDRVGNLVALGLHEVHGMLRHVWRIAHVEAAIGREVIPAIVDL